MSRDGDKFVFNFGDDEVLDVFGLGKQSPRLDSCRQPLQSPRRFCNLGTSASQTQRQTRTQIQPEPHSRLMNLQLEIASTRELIRKREEAQRLRNMNGKRVRDACDNALPEKEGEPKGIDDEIPVLEPGALSAPITTTHESVAAAEKKETSVDDAKLVKLRLNALRSLAMRKRQKHAILPTIQAVEHIVVDDNTPPLLSVQKVTADAHDGRSTDKSNTLICQGARIQDSSPIEEKSLDVHNADCTEKSQTVNCRDAKTQESLSVEIKSVGTHDCLSTKKSNTLVCQGTRTREDVAGLRALSIQYDPMVQICVEKEDKARKERIKQIYYLRFTSTEAALRAKNGMTGAILSGRPLQVGMLKPSSLLKMMKKIKACVITPPIIDLTADDDDEGSYHLGTIDSRISYASNVIDSIFSSAGEVQIGSGQIHTGSTDNPPLRPSDQLERLREVRDRIVSSLATKKCGHIQTCTPNVGPVSIGDCDSLYECIVGTNDYIIKNSVATCDISCGERLCSDGDANCDSWGLPKSGEWQILPEVHQRECNECNNNKSHMIKENELKENGEKDVHEGYTNFESIRSISSSPNYGGGGSKVTQKLNELRLRALRVAALRKRSKSLLLSSSFQDDHLQQESCDNKCYHEGGIENVNDATDDVLSGTEYKNSCDECSVVDANNDTSDECEDGHDKNNENCDNMGIFKKQPCLYPIITSSPVTDASIIFPNVAVHDPNDICGGSKAPDTGKEIERLQAREQLLAHKIEVQTIRNEINRTQSLLTSQSDKLAKARKVHDNLCRVEKDQFRLLSSLRRTKQQLLKRSAKASLYRIELMADVSSARSQHALVQKATREPQL